MSERNPESLSAPQPEQGARHAGLDELVPRVIRAAGERPTLSAEALARIHDNVHAQWHQQTQPARRQRRWGALAAAASVLAISAAVLLRPAAPPAIPGLTLAHVERALGRPMARGDVADPWTPVQEMTAIAQGQTLRTGANDRIALRTTPGMSLRLDNMTELTLLAPGQVQLHQGRIYVDSQPAATGAINANAQTHATGALEVLTPLGRATDIGTQFLVGYQASPAQSEATMWVLVREGLVQVQTHPARATAAAGEQLLVRNNGVLEPSALQSGDTRWAWIESVSPHFNTHGRSAYEFLRWVSRERGMALRFASPRIEQQARQRILSGDIGPMPPSQALVHVLASTELDYAIADDTITITIGAD